MTVYTNQLFRVMSLILQYPDGSSKLDDHTCQNPESDQFSGKQISEIFKYLIL